MPMTPAQQEAIAARGNVIVVAGAGTGKTSTLVERCVALLSEGCSIEGILMVTFTEAAAAEMRHRLHERLAQPAAAADPDEAMWWQEQVALLETAQICTLHSFCLQLIRENFHLLAIDPAVKVLDEQQVRPLIEEALETTLQPHFVGAMGESVAVRDLILRYGGGDSGRIRSLVLQLHRHAQSLESAENWFARQLAALEVAEPVQWREWLLMELHAWARRWLSVVQNAAREAGNLRPCEEALGDLWSAGLAQAGPLLEDILGCDADWPGRQKTRLREPVKEMFEEAAFLASQFASVAGVEGLAADWENVRHPLRALLHLTQEFAVRFAALKREAGGIDFSDLEQFALRLLWDQQGELSSVARTWQARLECVFVDECQDINAAQDAILRALSRRGEPARDSSDGKRPVDDMLANRFLVGDVKQSIYRFRMARPELFMGYESRWVGGTEGRRVLLADNFRSAPEVIGFVNALFGSLMLGEAGGVGYESLVAGRSASEFVSLAQDERRVEFHLITKEAVEQAADGEGDELLAVEREARLVALRLQELHRNGTQIWDREHKCLRRIEWRDMAVLLRSPSGRVEAFAKEFHKCGVPLQAARGGFFESTEILDLLSLVRLLDNPLQDIPLLAVLRSPLVGLTLDEIAELRIRSRQRRLWAALHELGNSSDGAVADLRGRVRRFLDAFVVWREVARQSALSGCVERALKDTQYELLIGAGERGAERAANVRKFVRMVREYDPFQRQGVSRFLRFVDGLLAAEQDVEPAPAPSQNAVRLMSIHRSKGLEFPVVVVACLGTQFNLGDLHRDVLLDEQFGLCAKAVVPQAGERHPTVAHWLASRRQHRLALAEELRLLYVAATRARDHLIMVGTAARRDSVWESQPGHVIGAGEIVAARSPLDWLLRWLPAVTRGEDWREGWGANDLLRWRLVLDPKEWGGAADQEGSGAARAVEPAGISAGSGSEFQQIGTRIRWQYPHSAATQEAAKSNVTALRHRAERWLDEDASDWTAGPRVRRASATVPMGGAAQAGTLHHRFLEVVDVAQADDEAKLRAQLSASVARGVFTPDEAAAIDLGAVARFWRSQIGVQIARHAAGLRREVPFTARFSLREVAEIIGLKAVDAATQEFVVVQGVADLVVLTDQEAWLLDFKTDDVPGGELNARAQRYRPQLRLYASALAGIYRKPVSRCWLHFLRTGETVEV